MQVLVDPAAGSILLCLFAGGDQDGDPFVVELSAIGLAELITELSSAAIVMAKHENARATQQRDAIQQLLIERQSSQ